MCCIGAGDRERLETTLIILAFAVCLGTIGGLAASLVPTLAPQIFTPDTQLWPLMRSVAFMSLASMVLVGTDVGSTSVLYAYNDAGFLAKSMMWNLALVSAFFYGVKRFGWDLTGVWWGLVFFFSLRALWSTPRLWMKHLRKLVRSTALQVSK